MLFFFFLIDEDTVWGQTTAIIRKQAIFSHFVMGSTVIAVILINSHWVLWSQPLDLNVIFPYWYLLKHPILVAHLFSCVYNGRNFVFPLSKHCLGCSLIQHRGLSCTELQSWCGEIRSGKRMTRIEWRDFTGQNRGIEKVSHATKLYQ